MAKDEGKKEQNDKDYEKFYEAWLDLSKDLTDRIPELTKEGAKRYEDLYGLWSEYAQLMSEKLGEVSTEDKPGFEEMQKLWGEYSDRMGQKFVDLFGKKDIPYKELYQLWSEDSTKMGEQLTGLMNERIKRQKDLYELWMDAFSVKDAAHLEDLSQFWREMWERSQSILASDGGDKDYAVKWKELNDLWTEECSKMIMDAIGRPGFAEMNGDVLTRNLEMLQESQQSMKQYLSAVGLPTKDHIDEIYRKLHELDRKISEVARTVNSSKDNREVKG